MLEEVGKILPFSSDKYFYKTLQQIKLFYFLLLKLTISLFTGGSGSPSYENNNTEDGGKEAAPTHPRQRWRCMQPRLCNYCWKTFSNSFNLKQHIVNVHIQSQGVNCTICDKVVKNKWYLRKHLVTAHGAPLKRSKNTENNNITSND